MDINSVIEHYQLEKHPEGGWFRKMWSSDVKSNIPERHCGSYIYYLIGHGEFSAFHSIDSDELWSVLYSSSYEAIVRIYHINPCSGELSIVDLGTVEHTLKNPSLKSTYVVPSGHIFSVEVISNNPNAVILCTCSLWPEFSEDSWKLWKDGGVILSEQFPQHKHLFERLCLKS